MRFPMYTVEPQRNPVAFRGLQCLRKDQRGDDDVTGSCGQSNSVSTALVALEFDSVLMDPVDLDQALATATRFPKPRRYRFLCW